MAQLLKYVILLIPLIFTANKINGQDKLYTLSAEIIDYKKFEIAARLDLEWHKKIINTYHRHSVINPDESDVHGNLNINMSYGILKKTELAASISETFGTYSVMVRRKLMSRSSFSVACYSGVYFVANSRVLIEGYSNSKDYSLISNGLSFSKLLYEKLSLDTHLQYDFNFKESNKANNYEISSDAGYQMSKLFSALANINFRKTEHLQGIKENYILSTGLGIMVNPNSKRSFLYSCSFDLWNKNLVKRNNIGMTIYFH